MGKKFFIAGTDTEIGKTTIACGLLEAGNQRGWRTLALKPVAAGAEPSEDGPRNDDAVALMQSASVKLSYEQVNPVLFEPPIAPHIAAQQVGKRLTVSQLAGYCRGSLMTPSDLALVEGAGGWRVPLSGRETLAGLAVELQLLVILVVGMKLGCLNHALLTAEAIRRDGLQLAGWVANTVDSNMSCFEENVETLRQLLPAPCLGVVPSLSDCSPDKVAAHLQIDLL
ncbi:MAG: dethiobiotin synthase [Spongiibacteraceae bacterium]|jgi:dethiobiotin synthetase|nr:dethiobiotin synthase [Spongiibacteraceae bacterium]